MNSVNCPEPEWLSLQRHHEPDLFELAGMKGSREFFDFFVTRAMARTAAQTGPAHQQRASAGPSNERGAS